MRAMKIPVVHIFGVPVSKMGMDQTVEYVSEVIREKKPHQVITVNPIMVMAAVDNPEYLAMMKRAELIIPDGTGVVWAAQYIENPVSERVPGIDFIHRLFEIGQNRKWKVYFLGASREVVEAAAHNIQRQYPRLQIVGVRDGFFTADDDQAVIADIVQAQPDILLVGRSADKQETWIDQYKHQLNVPVMIGVGGSFDVISGKLKRAPILFQKLRLEWFYRLLQEPWRYKRMLMLPKFVVKVIREKENVQKP